MSNPTVAIPQERVSELEAAIEKLNKKAEKLGCPPISVEIGESFSKQISPAQWADFVPVTINGEAPKLNGWVFVATLEHDENGTLIRRLPAFDNEVDLSQYRKATPDNCDHCGYKRRRNDTYIVAKAGDRHEVANKPWSERYQTKQVGSSCLKDFIGHENPEAIAKHLQSVRDLIESIQGGSYSGGHITPRYDLATVMAVAVAEVTEHGYVTRKAAWEDPELVSTSEAVRTRWHRYLSSDHERAQISHKHRQIASLVIDWVRSLEEEDLTNDYLWNLFVVCKGESIEESQFGIAASAVKAAEKAWVQRSRAVDGDRHQGRVTRVHDAPTDKQLEYIVKLADELGLDANEIPGIDTRIGASDIINDLKARVAQQREEHRAAGETGMTPTPVLATEKQLSYINKLMDQKSIPADKRQEARKKIDAGLTKARASQCIEWLQTFEDAS